MGILRVAASAFWTNWRVVFCVEDGEAVKVDLIDYH